MYTRRILRWFKLKKPSYSFAHRIPDEVLLQIKKRKTNSEVEAYRVALEPIRALHFSSVRADMTSISSTPGKINKAESLGKPHYTKEDGCRAWVIERQWTDHS
jgi:hypothetical protein